MLAHSCSAGMLVVCAHITTNANHSKQNAALDSLLWQLSSKLQYYQLGFLVFQPKELCVAYVSGGFPVYLSNKASDAADHVTANARYTSRTNVRSQFCRGKTQAHCSTTTLTVRV